MSTSIEKVDQLRADLTGPPPADATPQQLMLRTLVMQGGGFLDSILPTDPHDLDSFLTWAGEELLRLRSDDYDPDAVQLEGTAEEEPAGLDAGHDYGHHHGADIQHEPDA